VLLPLLLPLLSPLLSPPSPPSVVSAVACVNARKVQAEFSIASSHVNINVLSEGAAPVT